jgi:hypothetical protein
VIFQFTIKMVSKCGICIDTQTTPEKTINKIGLNNPILAEKYMILFVVKSNYILHKQYNNI